MRGSSLTATGTTNPFGIDYFIQRQSRGKTTTR
jgi:hypothetical protein